MKNWKGYNILDLILILVGVITVTTTSIIFHSQWYIILNTILGLLCVFTQAKGKIATQFIGVIYFCFYIAISYSQKYYGEAILYLTIMLPMYVYGVIHWLKNRDEKDQNTVLVRSKYTAGNMDTNDNVLIVSCEVLRAFKTKYTITDNNIKLIEDINHSFLDNL